MNSTNYTSAALNKKIFDTLYLTDEYDNRLLLVRSWNRKGFYNIAKCEVLTDGKIPNRDGLIPNAVFYSNEEVADLITESEEYHGRLAKAEASLLQWIKFRNAWSRKPNKKGKLRLQRKEMPNQ